MNRDLLEALGAIAAEVYFDALGRHPGLFLITGSESSDDDQALLPVLICIDELIAVIHEALHPTDIKELLAPEAPDTSPYDDDIPF